MYDVHIERTPQNLNHLYLAGSTYNNLDIDKAYVESLIKEDIIEQDLTPLLNLKWPENTTFPRIFDTQHITLTPSMSCVHSIRVVALSADDQFVIHRPTVSGPTIDNETLNGLYRGDLQLLKAYLSELDVDYTVTERPGEPENIKEELGALIQKNKEKVDTAKQFNPALIRTQAEQAQLNFYNVLVDALNQAFKGDTRYTLNDNNEICVATTMSPYSGALDLAYSTNLITGSVFVKLTLNTLTVATLTLGMPALQHYYRYMSASVKLAALTQKRLSGCTVIHQ